MIKAVSLEHSSKKATSLGIRYLGGIVDGMLRLAQPLVVRGHGEVIQAATVFWSIWTALQDDLLALVLDKLSILFGEAKVGESGQNPLLAKNSAGVKCIWQFILCPLVKSDLPSSVTASATDERAKGAEMKEVGESETDHAWLEVIYDAAALGSPCLRWWRLLWLSKNASYLIKDVLTSSIWSNEEGDSKGEEVFDTIDVAKDADEGLDLATLDLDFSSEVEDEGVIPALGFIVGMNRL